jgi:hypothetical protein
MQEVTNRGPAGFLKIGHGRLCECPPTHINCMNAKEWLKSQLGVWEFFYEGRDIRDKNLHPATFPISLARHVIKRLSHCGIGCAATVFPRLFQ